MPRRSRSQLAEISLFRDNQKWEFYIVLSTTAHWGPDATLWQLLKIHIWGVGLDATHDTNDAQLFARLGENVSLWELCDST